MSRTPGPVYVEVNSELARSPSFVCLKDELKAAYLLWALLHPEGDLPGPDHLGLAIGKTKAKAFAIIVALKFAGFIVQSPNGKLTLTEGWVRPHKGSAARMAKLRSKAAGADVNSHSDVTMRGNVTPIVTLHTASQWADCNVTSDADVTSQKEVPPTPPLRKTSNNPEEESGLLEGVQVRATPSKLPLFKRDYWHLGQIVPESWRRIAERERAQLGLPPVDIDVVASTFSSHQASLQNQPRTHTEWGALFIKFTVKEIARSTNGPASRPSQLEQLAAIAERELSAAGGTVLEN